MVEIVGDPKDVETGGFSLTVAASRVFCLLKDGGGPLVTGVWLARKKNYNNKNLYRDCRYLFKTDNKFWHTFNYRITGSFVI